MLYEAGMLDKTGENWTILKPILDAKMQQWLENHEMAAFVNALAGVR